MALNPLALTQVLPFLPLAQGDIDYETERRGEPDLLRKVLLEPSTTVMLTCDGRVAVPRGQGAKADYENAAMRLATLPGAYVLDALERHPGAVGMFLGGYTGLAGGQHVVAVDITRIDGESDEDCNAGDAGTVDGQLAGYGQCAANGADNAGNTGKADILQQATARFDWVDLRGFAPHANAREAGQATSAVALSVWHNRQRHCPACGAPVTPAMGGWAQRCSSSADGNRLLFPRVEPAVITVVVDSSDRMLIQHNAAWNNPTLYSVSAGFVEAGENLEHAVRRDGHYAGRSQIPRLAAVAVPGVADDGVQGPCPRHRHSGGRFRNGGRPMGDQGRIHGGDYQRTHQCSGQSDHCAVHDRAMAGP